MKFDKRTMERVVTSDVAEGDYIVTRTAVGSHIEIAEGLVDTIHEFNGFKGLQDAEGYVIYDEELSDFSTDFELYRLSAFEAKFMSMDESKIYIGPSNHASTSVMFWYDTDEDAWSGANLVDEKLGIDAKALLHLLETEVGFEEPGLAVKISLENSDLNQIKEYDESDYHATEKGLKEGRVFISADKKNLYTFEEGRFYTYVRHNYYGLKNEYKQTMHTLALPKDLTEHVVEFKDIFERDIEKDQILYNVKTKSVYKIRKGVSNQYMIVIGSNVSHSYNLTNLMKMHLRNELVEL